MILFNDANEVTSGIDTFLALPNRGRFILLRFDRLSSRYVPSWGLMGTFHSWTDCYTAYNKHVESEPETTYRVADIGIIEDRIYHLTR